MEPGQRTGMRLPAPVPVVLVRPAVLLTRQLRLDVRALRLLVTRPSRLVPHPPPAEHVAPFLPPPYREWNNRLAAAGAALPLFWRSKNAVNGRLIDSAAGGAHAPRFGIRLLYVRWGDGGTSRLTGSRPGTRWGRADLALLTEDADQVLAVEDGDEDDER